MDEKQQLFETAKANTSTAISDLTTQLELLRTDYTTIVEQKQDIEKNV